MLAPELHEDNRRSWNSATKAHNSHKGDQAAFLRSAGSTLFPEELDLLGDVAGKRIAHLQCNSGQDSLSLAALGADVTGVDISDEAISFATRLSAESGIAATFVRTDLFDWFERAAEAGERFDVVFCSYGTLCWLSDLGPWAKGIAAVLAPGGRFVIVDFHPTARMFDWEWKPVDNYWMADNPHYTYDSGVGDYVSASKDGLVPWGYEDGLTRIPDPNRCHEFTWGLAEIITALLTAGLSLDVFQEYAWTNGCISGERMRELPGRRYLPPADVPSFPMMYGIRALSPTA
jgi:SAM-dependent methyltransferase